MKKLHLLIAIGLSLGLTACASFDFSRRIVQQGNLLPEAKLSQIHPGMSKEKVAVILGSSLLSPTFNNNRWDYAYTWRRGSGPMTVRHAVIYFNGRGAVTRVEHG